MKAISFAAPIPTYLATQVAGRLSDAWLVARPPAWDTTKHCSMMVAVRCWRGLQRSVCTAICRCR
jgi:hypothetical protein